MIVRFSEINWDLYDEEESDSDASLPTEVLVHQNYFLPQIDDIQELESYLYEFGVDFLTDNFGFFVNSLSIEIVEDVWNYKWMSDNKITIFSDEN